MVTKFLLCCVVLVASGYAETKQVAIVNCDFKCSLSKWTVCGSDGVSYDNPCLVKKAMCVKKEAIAIIGPGNCDAIKKCDLKCPLMKGTVCGSDRVTYDNPCLLREASCVQKKAIAIVRSGNCIDEPTTKIGATKKCEFKCPLTKLTVCGSDGKSYDHPCLVREASCLEQKAIIVIRRGSCIDDQAARCVFKSSRMTRPKMGPTRRSKMGPTRRSKMGPTRRSKMGSTRKTTVCGSDHKKYNSRMEMVAESCRQGIAIVPVSLYKDTPCSECTTICSKTTRLVCGSDGKTHINKCHLLLASCKAQSAIIQVHGGGCR